MASRSRRLKAARKRKQDIARALESLAAGDTSLEHVLTHDGVLSRVRVWTVLTRAKGLGEVGARKALVQARVFPEDKLGSLNEKQISRIIECLPPRVRGDHSTPP